MASLLVVVAMGSFAFRWPRLELRPMHADEAVQAARFRELCWGRGYRYDPQEFHGPTLSYATLPSVWISRPETFAATSERTYRIVPVVFGASLVLLLGLLSDGLGRCATVSAALWLCLSPAMVFYSRYYIHETLLVFFTLAAIGTAWRYAHSGRWAWCLAAGVALGLMQATKETAVLAYAAAILALGLVHFVSWWSTRGITSDLCLVRGRHLLSGGFVATLVAVLFLSSFGRHLRGPWDGILTYMPWLQRAGGASLHVQPWYFYLQRMAWWKLADGPRWSEGLILVLSGVGLWAGILRPQWLPGGASVRLVRWLGAYTLSLTVFYSLIPYKTPWCLLQFLLGYALLAGVGTAVLLSPGPPLWRRAVNLLVILPLTGHLAWQAYRASYVLPSDPRNPYVYAQSVDDMLRLDEDLQQLAQAVPREHVVAVSVIWDGPYYWPLPWYARRFDAVSYSSQVPQHVTAPIVLAAPRFDKALTGQLQDTHLMTGYYGVRPGVMAELWVDLNLWQAHLRRLGRLPAQGAE